MNRDMYMHATPHEFEFRRQQCHDIAFLQPINV